MRTRIVAGLALLAPVSLRAQMPAARPPQLMNPDSVAAAVDKAYTPDLLKQQLGGIVQLRVHVTVDGAVDSALVAAPTGAADLDSAAVGVARLMRFTPAIREGQPVAMWAVLPLEFRRQVSVVPGLKKRGPVQRLELTNRAAVADAAEARYPDDARKFGLLVRATLRLAVDSAGAVRGVALDSTSCFDYFDQVALQLAGMMRFPPREPADTAAERLTAAKVSFGPDSVEVSFPGDSVARRPGAPDTVHFYTVAPVLTNRQEVAQFLGQTYRGRGGKAVVWALIDEAGAPDRRMIKTTSGVCGVDLAALRVVQAMRFSPGLLDGKPVKVWIAMPIILH